MISSIISRILRHIQAFHTDARGNVMLLSAMAMPVLVGRAGLAIGSVT